MIVASTSLQPRLRDPFDFSLNKYIFLFHFARTLAQNDGLICKVLFAVVSDSPLVKISAGEN